MSEIVLVRSARKAKKLFNEMKGQAVVMDQKSYERLKSVLPARVNMVDVGSSTRQIPGCFPVDGIGAAIRLAMVSEGHEKLFVIGNRHLRRSAAAYNGNTSGWFWHVRAKVRRMFHR